jgi:hypothetical protein
LTVARFQQLGLSFGMQGMSIHPQLYARLSFENYRGDRQCPSYVTRICSRLALTYPTELVLRASNDLSLFKKISYKTLQSIEQSQSFDGNPLYAILHEALYCQGYVHPSPSPSGSENSCSMNLPEIRLQTGLRNEFCKVIRNSIGTKAHASLWKATSCILRVKWLVVAPLYCDGPLTQILILVRSSPRCLTTTPTSGRGRRQPRF